MGVVKFNIIFNKNIPFGVNALGIDTDNSRDLETFSKIIQVVPESRYDNGELVYSHLKVELNESDPTLQCLYETIYRCYNVKPSKFRVWPLSERGLTFGVLYKINYSESELDQCKFLCVESLTAIGQGNSDRNDKDIINNHYFLRGKRRNQKLIGNLDFTEIIGVSSSLKQLLLQEKLKGLELNQHLDKESSTWRLWSELSMPRSVTKLVNRSGEEIKNLRNWDKFEWRQWETRYTSPILTYRKESLKQVGDFDIAMTAERAGGHYHTAFKRYVISQRFRNVLIKLKLKDLNFTPVKLIN